MTCTWTLVYTGLFYMEIVAACKLECHFYTCIFTNIMRSDICSEGNKPWSLLQMT